jgi:hypothetical protein
MFIKRVVLKENIQVAPDWNNLEDVLLEIEV